MPEFILDRGSPEASRKFSEQSYFVQGYIEAMFFTNTGTGDDEDLKDATVAELSPEAWRAIITDCTAFQDQASALLEQAYARGYEEDQAGRDYWFTRNGHGVGFWDREVLEADDLGELLSETCRHDDSDIYRGDDGLIYIT